MRYISKPQVVEAIQWTGDNIDDVVEFFRPSYDANPGIILAQYNEVRGTLKILAGKEGEQGWVPVPKSNYIVRSEGVYNDYWPVEPNYFENKYDEIV